MECPKCQIDNPSDSKYCKECATPLTHSEDIQPSFTKTLETPVEELTRGALFAGRYEIIEELGKGGMGKVYRVEDTKTKEEIALKLIKPEIATDKKTIDRFRNELTTARKIRHKNICGMYDLDEDKGAYYITMEYIPGEDLKSMIRMSGRLAVGTTISIAKQLCGGLSEAHKLGVVHRDLKPSNIMIDREGNVRIMDFGIARSLKERGITGAGVMIGTPEYMSPEQVEAKEVDQRSDIYSLGIVLYEMTTGKLPFEADTPFAVGVKQKSEKPENPRDINPQIPEDLSRVILKCLEKDKEARYQSAGELRSELDRIEKGIPTTERKITERKPLTSREITVQLSLKKLFIPAVIVIAIAVIGVIIWQFLPQKEAVLAPKIENSIAVISFKNQTGDPAYDYLQEVIPNLLITNLENTGLFYVTTWERMQDILKQMGIKQVGVIDSDLGFKLCQREGIEAIAIGTFSKAGDVFIMDVKVLDAETKQTLKSTNTKGTGADSIFDSQIDKLSRDISLGLGAGIDKVEAAQLNIKGITTPSFEAYQYFLKGKEACNLHYWRSARENLQKALELDPTFAMAYVYLSWTYIEPGPAESIKETIEKAMAFSNKTSQKDRLYLDGLYAYFIEQDTKKAVMVLDELIQKYPDEKWALHIQGDFLRKDDDLDRAYARYKRWLELDPQDPNAFYHISNVSVMMGDLEKVEDYIKKHEEIAPPEAGNIALQAAIYKKLGQLDKAIVKRKKILEIRPDLRGNFRLIAEIYSLKEEYEEALKWANEYVSLASSLGQKRSSFFCRGTIHFLRGAFDDALADFTLAGQAAEQEENVEEVGYALEERGLVHLVRGDYESCRKYFENMPMTTLEDNLDVSLTYRVDRAFDLGILSLKQGQIGLANARLTEIELLQPEIRGNKIYIHFIRDLLQAEAQLAQGELEEALATGKMACGPDSPIWRLGYGFFGTPAYLMDLLARIYVKKGDIGQAISEYEHLFKVNYSTPSSFTIYPLYHYRLGLLYEKANEAVKAKAQLEKFLDLWKDADSGIAEVEDVRERLAGLS